MPSYIETTTMVSTTPILLQPRPLAREPGSILLVPLLPDYPRVAHLPWELWSHILHFVLFDNNVDLDTLDIHNRREHYRKRRHLLYVCKDWLGVSESLIYSDVHIFSISSLEMFVTHLYESEQKWDSIRRIPYSTPGRWVHSFDVSSISHTDPGEPLAIDRLLTKVFPLLPFLRALCLCSDLALSTTALTSLGAKDGQEYLTTLDGYKILWRPDDDRDTSQLALGVIARYTNLEHLDIANGSPYGSSSTYNLFVDVPDLHDPTFFLSTPALDLPRLTHLGIFAPCPTPTFAALLRAHLPALRHLTITPLDDSPDGAAHALLAVHGANLDSLRINSPCTWLLNITGDLPSPRTTVLRTSPHLRVLMLGYPVEPLAPPLSGGHPIEVITIPRPTRHFKKSFEMLLPLLPNLSTVRLSNVKWLMSGMYGRALETGVQGEMREWRNRLAKRNVRLVDMNWLDPI